MNDQSHLDSKYFLSPDTYNCPFCNRRHIQYANLGSDIFNWSNDKQCRIWRVRCAGCGKISMHLTFQNLQAENRGIAYFRDDVDLDNAFFYSVPTSFFVVDRRIPNLLRKLITEAEGCAKMNYLTGASACTRKAIYELLRMHHVEGPNYDDKIRAMRNKFPSVDAELFEVLGHVKDMTSDHVHEESWEAWSSSHLQLFLEALKAVLHEIYVVPDEKKTRIQSVRSLREELNKSKGSSKGSNSAADESES